VLVEWDPFTKPDPHGVHRKRVEYQDIIEGVRFGKECSTRSQGLARKVVIEGSRTASSQCLESSSVRG